MEKGKGKEKPDPKLTDIFSRRLASLNLKPKELGKLMDISSWAVSAYLNASSLPRADILKKLSDNIGRPMDWFFSESLDSQEMCPLKCSEKTRKLCEKVDRVINSDGSYSTALEANIKSFDEAVTEKDEIKKLKTQMENLTNELNNFKKTQSKGPSSGTSEKPARPTGSKEKVG